MPRIEDYALVGDTETAALISRDGSVDWLCVPRFDSPACFAALLGTSENGRWRIAPESGITAVERRYREGTLVLETDMSCAEGRVRILDFMPPRTREADLLRVVEGLEGTVPMRTEIVLRFDYGSVVPWVRAIDGGIRATAGPDTVFLRTDVPLRGEDHRTTGAFTVRAGERIAFDLTWCPTYADHPTETPVAGALEATERWWRDWSSRCRYEGPYREAVVRSLITLKALTYRTTGGIVAAPTTSLPEQPGGIRNWDYRFCWIRDATFTLYALVENGYTEEARAWREWLVNAVAGEPSELQIMYGIAGERRLTELEIPWLDGFEESKPVRVGNDAWRQFQLDVYGEVMDALQASRRAGLPPDENAWRVQRELMAFLAEGWRRPDHGLWEIRGEPCHFTHSKVMAWVAFDRAVRAVEEHGLPGPVEGWRAVREEIHREVCREGVDRQRGTFVQCYGSREVDASLLTLPLMGFLPAEDPRVVATVEAVRADLERDGFVHRYRSQTGVDGLPPGEGAFLLCTFWLADVLALLGRTDEAAAIFERLLTLRNDVGLLAEEVDPRSGRMLGNFPQAFSHVGLINTALNLSRRRGPAEKRSH